MQALFLCAPALVMICNPRWNADRPLLLAIAALSPTDIGALIDALTAAVVDVIDADVRAARRASLMPVTVEPSVAALARAGAL